MEDVIRCTLNKSANEIKLGVVADTLGDRIKIQNGLKSTNRIQSDGGIVWNKSDEIQ